MKRAAVVLGGCLLVAGWSIAQDEAAKVESGRPATKAPPRGADEAAIREVLAAFTKAFNAGDAKALAALFAEDAQIEQEDGTILDGRAAIEDGFTRLFADGPRGSIELRADSIAFLGDAAALEDGTSTLTLAEGEAPELGRYTVLYAKHGGKWLHQRVRELPAELTPYDHLKELEWMVGEWVNENSDSVVHTTCAWSDNKCYLLREFTVHIAGRPAMTGTQRIGWDPLTKQIRSWVFDSEGGFAEGIWSRRGNQWLSKMRGVLRDGRPVSATQVVTYLDKDSSTWASVDRTVGGEVMPDQDVYTLVRRPPPPKASAPAGKATSPEGASR